MPHKPDPLIAEARERWTRCEEAEQDQRKRILKAKQFRAGDQWPAAIRIQREGGQAMSGQAAAPPRPCLTIDRLSQPCRQVSNTIKSANFAIDVMPNGHGADTETANIFKGYLRYVQNRSRGDSPVEWAADQAIEGGIGWFRIRTDYVYENDEGVDPVALFDQELKLERIQNNLTVYSDPWSTRPTKADAQFMFVVEDLSRDEFKRRYKKTEADLASLDDFASTGNPPKGWIEAKTVRVAEYWRIDYDDRKVSDGQHERTLKVPKVSMDIINALESLQHFDWVGSRIPLIPVLGEELNIDGKQHCRGIIEEGMDAQKMVNYTYSGAVEIFALGAKDAPIVAEGQIENFKDIWQMRTVTNLSYLPYTPVSLLGSPVPPPQWNTHEPPIQAAALLLQVSEEAIRATTGIHEPSLGAQSDKGRSGRAIQALQGQSDLGTSNYPDNVRRALIYAGELMVEIIPKITRPGQMLQILGHDDQPKQVIVGQPFVEQPNGQPQPVDQMADPERQQLDQAMVKFYDFSKGRYAVTVAVGKSYTTKREEGAAAIGELIPALPPPMQAAIAPEFIEELSFPGAHKIAEVARRALPPELQAPKDGEQPIPPEVKQQMAQMQQAMQAMTQELEQAKQMIATDQIKAQQSYAETQLKEQTENQRAGAKIQVDAQIKNREIEARERENALNNLVKLAIADLQAQTSLSQQHAEQARTALGFEHEHAEGEADRQFKGGQAERDRDVQQTEAERERQAAAAAQPAGV